MQNNERRNLCYFFNSGAAGVMGTTAPPLFMVKLFILIYSDIIIVKATLKSTKSSNVIGHGFST